MSAARTEEAAGASAATQQHETPAFRFLAPDVSEPVASPEELSTPANGASGSYLTAKEGRKPRPSRLNSTLLSDPAGGDASDTAAPFPPTASARWHQLRQKLRESGLGGAGGEGQANGGGPAHQSTMAMAVSGLRKKRKETGNQKTAASKVTGGIDLTKELESGVLPVFLVKMAFERDEQSNRRIPVLLNHVKLRIADSISATSTSGATVFRIELEYGDGLCRWVVYRQLRDFINLHAHYRAAALRGILGRPVGASDGEALDLPSFPKTSIPYFNRLTGSGSTGQQLEEKLKHQNEEVNGEVTSPGPHIGQGTKSKAEFARAQREALQAYVLELIRRVMFRPEANRILRFFEMSALGISLASRGGIQGKQGFLRIMSSNTSRKSQHKTFLHKLNIVEKREPRWCIVRESYLVIVEQPDSLQVWDVFLFDNDFSVERPKRLYKQTFQAIDELAHGDCSDDEVDEGDELAAADAGGGVGVRHKHNHKRHSEDKDATLRGTPSKSKFKDTAALLTGGQFTDRAIRKEDDKKKNVDEKGNVKAPKAKIKRRKASAAAVTGVSNHTFYIKNAERKIKLVAPNERQMEQFIASIERIAEANIFTGQNRFDSTFPIRLNCSAQWLADGRDYYWNASKALLMAKERIYIHDWWLSPELYLRRPGRPKYRLDHILKKKAEQGVKIFVILYSEVSNSFTPTDSGYTKHRLLELHPNIYVQRSPNHIQVGQFFWAHHEKLLVVDEVIAFMGGFDLCFGRYDTPAHVLVDDAELTRDEHEDPLEPAGKDPSLFGPSRSGAEAHIWPGQDYANERVIEWHTLSKPEQDLFARDKYPRMPWHDVGIQLVGQPARDLCRHFVQRWDYLLRIKNHTRVMPFLLPPPDFLPAELEQYGLMGKCEAQICRSAGPWSLGLNKVECSIQNAYLKAIQLSDHFIYIENQFFVTSTVVEGTKIENKIGDALVSRIIRAHREGTPWRAIIVIPLIPGFPMPIDSADATSIRIIVQCQARSISRGQHSIFGRLRREGIDPEDYISFFSLRNWGKLRGGQLVTEQVYIHGKILIADDRLALIGSANINERSQLGSRDSELAVVVRDTELVDGKMAGQPYKVGPFAHSLRLRLMREHLGLDVDELEERELHEQDRTADTMESSTSSLSGDKDPKDPVIDPAIFEDPLAEDFYKDVWLASAQRNTELFRMVFKSVPDDTVTTWAQYKAFVSWSERLGRSAPKRASTHQDNLGQYAHPILNEEPAASKNDGAPSASSQTASPSFAEKLLSPLSADRGKHQNHGAATASSASGTAGRRSTSTASSDSDAGAAERKVEHAAASMLPAGLQPARGPSDAQKATRPPGGGHQPAGGPATTPVPAATDTFTDRELERMEALLEELQGNLVLHPTRFLEAEDLAGNFIFASDLLQSNMTFAVFA